MKKFFAKILTMLLMFIAPNVTLDSRGRIGKWYETNGFYKFPIGSIIALKSICSFGYGIRPVGTVKGYTDDGNYLIEMEQDVDGDYYALMKGTYVPKGQRSSSQVTHFKWNIEYHFKKVRQTDPKKVYA